MAGQVQQNAITRKLAAWAAILAVPTAIAGMNFQNMPELQWKYGYCDRRHRRTVPRIKHFGGL